MSGYNGRRGPNVSQFIANLNIIPSAQDLQEPLLNIEEDLALFTNTDFIDWDHNDLEVPGSLDYDPAAERRSRRMNASRSSYHSNHDNGSASKPDFNNGDFQFQDFSGFNNSITDPQLPNLSTTGAAFPLTTYGSPISNSASPVSPQFGPAPGEKRKLDAITDPNGAVVETESSRIAAEEDKRRRNTAASARFRVKKKQREQALEKTAKEMTDKVGVLESKITQLEMENKWLKSLITEKNESSADVNAMFKKFQQSQESAGARSTGERTDGVGTGNGGKEKAKA